MRTGFRITKKGLRKIVMLAIFTVILLAGCATTPMETHQKGMESIAEKEYFIPKRPVDHHYIGCAWLKQFGPVEDPGADDIRIKVEKSFNTMQQEFAYNVGVSLGGQSTKGATVEAGVEAGKAKISQLEDVQIISPVSLADVPFEMNIPYITEALRLGNFALKSEKAGKAGLEATVSSVKAGAKGAMVGGAGTTGIGLVVAYKLHMIDPKTYAKLDSGSIALELDKTMDFPKANLFARSSLSYFPKLLPTVERCGELGIARGREAEKPSPIFQWGSILLSSRTLVIGINQKINK